MRIRLVTDEHELEALREPWERLAAASSAPSFFSSHLFVSHSWQYSRQPGDSLYVLTGWERVQDAEELVAVAPWRLKRHRTRGIPIRTLEWIAAWEGDRPRLVHRGNPATAWRALSAFLAGSGGWDALDLVEQDTAAEAALREAFCGPHWLVETEPDAESFFISLDQTFDAYMESRPRKVRANWRNRRKRLLGDDGLNALRVVEDPSAIVEAFGAFTAMEQSGWKKGSGVGAAKDENHRAFYQALLTDCARRGEAAIYFLTSEGRDVAGSVFFRYGGVHYERHITYSEDLAGLSPGIILRSEVLAHLMRKPGGQVDLLGMRHDEAGQQHKRDWATRSERTTRVIVWRRAGRGAPLLLARALREWWRGRPPEADAGPTPAAAAQEAEGPKAAQ